jgi:hypothetical protein
VTRRALDIARAANDAALARDLSARIASYQAVTGTSSSHQ